jgi:tryptophanyl-tRNA synthetase
MELSNQNNRKTVFSGVQPSGVLHLGNYLGMLVQGVAMQDQYSCIFCVVDYHAITVKQEPKALSRRILDTVKIYLASGINPEKAVIFQQSDITEHTELAWILNCAAARMADLNKMTQFKEKGANQTSASVGLYDYPVLMASDILLYNTDLVPVGEDQVQHVELTRTLAERFNRDYGQTFKLPAVAVRKQGARIMGLDDPSKKMSKSASSPANYIALTDLPEVAAKKIKRAVTDSGKEVKSDQAKPAIANLLTIFSLLSGLSLKELEANYKGKGYGDFKNDLAEEVKQFLTEFQIKYHSFKDDEVRQILSNGADKARPLARETLNRVKNKLGIIN